MKNYIDDTAIAESPIHDSLGVNSQNRTAAQIALERIGNTEIESLLKNTMGIYEDIAINGENSAFIKEENSFWLTELPPEILDTAKHILSTYQPENVQKLERMLPQLERICPEIRILRQTTPYSQMKFIPHLPPRITKPQVLKDVKSATPKTNITNPIKRHELSAGMIYSMTANGARKEDVNITSNIRQATNPFARERIDNTMFSFNNLYPHVANI